MSFAGMGGLCHSHVLEKGCLVSSVYQMVRITVSSVPDGLIAIILSGSCLGAIALAFRCRQILVPTVLFP
uniref:Uncharacterized protein n=1 Tax=Arundo donax TaxID=35708 RepID=A0A0A9HKL4_ARUDO